MSDAGGTIYAATVPPESFRRKGGGERLEFKDHSGKIAAGLTEVLIRPAKGGGTRVWARARRLDLRAADRPRHHHHPGPW